MILHPLLSNLNSDADVKGKLFHKNLSINSGAKLEITALTSKEIKNLRKD